MHGCMDGWMDGWMDGCMYVHIYISIQVDGVRVYAYIHRHREYNFDLNICSTLESGPAVLCHVNKS